MTMRDESRSAKRLPLICGLVAAGLTLLAPRSEAFLETGLSAAWSAQGMMAANPPLPMLRYPAGAWSVNLQPAYYIAKPGVSDGSQDRFSAGGRLTGAGGGASVSYAFAERWGAFAWVLGSRASGNATVTPKAGCAGCNELDLRSISASHEMLAAGLVYQAMGESDAGFALPVFAGPLLSHSSSRQTVNRSVGGVLQDDFDMTVSDLSIGLGAGAQAAMPLGRGFEFNPFVLTGLFFSGDCRSYEVTRQGLDNGFSATSDADCSGVRRIRAGEDRLLLAGGLNMIYAPWGVTLNLTAPLIGQMLATDNAKVSLFSVTWRYGRPKASRSN